VKKALLLILAILLCLTLCACGKEEPIDAEDTYTPELIFEVSSDLNSYVVKGLGGIPASKDIIIPATYQGVPVTAIGNSAFPGMQITSVTIPNSVAQIGAGAFYQSTNLTNITISNSVTEIGDEAFCECTGLTSIIYRGTKVQWTAIDKHDRWDYCTMGKYTVYCTDGEISD
jgi:hypothetical protein